MGQYVPTKESDVSRLRTGYEKILAHRTKMPFAYSALEDGKILEIDDKLKLIKIEYKSGKLVCIEYGTIQANYSGSGFHIAQHVVINGYQTGSKFKRGDIICYNEDFFQESPGSKQVLWKIGKMVNAAFIDNSKTLEDGCPITQRLSDALGFNPTRTRLLALTKGTNIHAIADVGTEVKSTDILMTFDESEIPESMRKEDNDILLEALNKINRATPKAKYPGKIVNIEVFYNCEISEMSDSLQTLVKRYTRDTNRKNKFASDTNSAIHYPKSTKMTRTNRIGNIVMEEDTVVFKFYIEQDMSVLGGDKIVLDSSLKSVVGTILPDIPIADADGREVDIIFGASSQANRIIWSVIKTGMVNGIMIKGEEDIVNMFFKD